MMTEVKKVLMAKRMAKEKMNEKESGSGKLQTSERKETEGEKDESERNDQVKVQKFQEKRGFFFKKN